MVSKSIANLSIDELNYLEKLLGSEFAKLSERKQQFKSKNGWSPGDDSSKVLRLLNAVRAQKRLSAIEKW